MMGETPQNAAAPRMWLLGAVTLSGTLGIHIFAPALALAAAALHATAPDLQLSIGLYVLGLALGQLVHGPLADRHGRRPILLCGMLIFVIGGVATMVATSAATLTIARFVQAFGGCAGLVLARAIVRDMAADSVAASGMAKLNLVMIVGPGIGPVLGGFVTALWGWRAPLGILVLIGSFNLWAILRWLPETRERPHAGNVLATYGRLLTTPSFLVFSVGGALATTAWYAFISAAPFLYEREYHLSAAETGIHLGIVVAGAWTGSLIASRLITDPISLMMNGQRLCIAASAGLLMTVMAGSASPVSTTVLMFLFTCGVGISGPAALAQSTVEHTAISGTASGLYGFIQMITGAVAATAASLGSNPAWSAISVLVLSGCLSLALFAQGRRYLD